MPSYGHYILQCVSVLHLFEIPFFNSPGHTCLKMTTRIPCTLCSCSLSRIPVFTLYGFFYKTALWTAECTNQPSLPAVRCFHHGILSGPSSSLHFYTRLSLLMPLVLGLRCLLYLLAVTVICKMCFTSTLIWLLCTFSFPICELFLFLKCKNNVDKGLWSFIYDAILCHCCALWVVSALRSV